MSCSMIELSNNQFVQMTSSEDTNAANKKRPSRRNPWGKGSYADLITQAIESSPEKRLTLSQIYDWMIRNIPHFSNQGSSNSSAGWKNSIRHNLSLHKKFLRIRNEGTTGKSSWWTVNKSVGTGRTTRRKNVCKRKKNKGSFQQKTEIFRKLKITGHNLLDCFFPNDEGGTRNLQRKKISKLALNSPKRRFKSCSSNSSEDNMSMHCDTTFNTDGYQDTFISYSNRSPYQTADSFLNDLSTNRNDIRTNYSLNKELKNEIETVSAMGSKLYGNYCDESDVYSKEQYLPSIASTFSIEENVSLNVSREYFKSPHHLSGSYITSEIGNVPSEISLQNSVYDARKAELTSYDLPRMNENIIHYFSAESNSFNFNQKTTFDNIRELQGLNLNNPQEPEISDRSYDSLSKILTFFKKETNEDQIDENKVNFHSDNFCKLDVELISKTRLLLEGSENSYYTEDSVDEEDNLTVEKKTMLMRKKQQSRKCIRRKNDFPDGERRTFSTNMDVNINSDKCSDYVSSPSDFTNSCSQTIDSDSFDFIPKSYTFTDGSQLEYLLCLERYSHYSLGFIPDMILNDCEIFYPVEVIVDYENLNEKSTNTEKLTVKKVKFSRFVPVSNGNTKYPILKPNDAVSKTIKAFINRGTENKDFYQKFPDTFDKSISLIHFLILNAVNMALLRIQIMSNSQCLIDGVVQTFNELSNTFTLKQMLCFAMEFLMLITNLYYNFIHKVVLNQFHLYAKSNFRLPKNASITNAGECIATYLNVLCIIINVQFSEKVLTDSKLRHFTSPPKFSTFVSAYLNDPDRINVEITKEELASTLNLLNHDFNLAFEWYSYFQPNAPFNQIIYAGYLNFPPDSDNDKENCENSYEYPVTCFEVTLPNFSGHHTVSRNFKIQLRNANNLIPSNANENNVEVESNHESSAVNSDKPTSTNTVDYKIQIDLSQSESDPNKGRNGPFNFCKTTYPMNLASTSSNFRNETQLQYTHNPVYTNVVETGVLVDSSHEVNTVNTDNTMLTNTVVQHIPVVSSSEAIETDIEKGCQFHSHEFQSPMNLAPLNFLNAIELQYADKSICSIQLDSSHEVNVESNNPIYTNIMKQDTQIDTTYKRNEANGGKGGLFHSREFSLPKNLAPASDNILNAIQLQYPNKTICTNAIKNNDEVDFNYEADTDANSSVPTNSVGHGTPIESIYEGIETSREKSGLTCPQEFSSNRNLAPVSSNCHSAIQLQYTDNTISTNTVDSNIKVYSSHEAIAANTDNLISTAFVGDITPINPSHKISGVNMRGSLYQSQEVSNLMKSASAPNILNSTQLYFTDNPRSNDTVDYAIPVCTSSAISETNGQKGVKNYNELRKVLMKRGENADILPTDLNDIDLKPIFKIPPITTKIYKNFDFYFGAYDNEFDNYLKQLKHSKIIM